MTFPWPRIEAMTATIESSNINAATAKLQPDSTDCVLGIHIAATQKRHVITSYSIHYTKLYELRAVALVAARARIHCRDELKLGGKADLLANP